MHQIPCTNSRGPCRLLNRAPFWPKRCHRSKLSSSCSSQLDQQLEGPTLVADAASRLSAAPEHTIHGLIASTSASTEQLPDLTPEAANQADSIVPHLTEQLGSEQSIGGLQQITPRCVNFTHALRDHRTDSLLLQLVSRLLRVLQLARTRDIAKQSHLGVPSTTFWYRSRCQNWAADTQHSK